MKSDIIYVGYKSIGLFNIGKYIKGVKDGSLIIIMEDDYIDGDYLLFSDSITDSSIFYKFADTEIYNNSNDCRREIFYKLEKKQTDVVILSYNTKFIKRNIIYAEDLDIDGSYDCYNGCLYINDIYWNKGKTYARNLIDKNKLDWIALKNKHNEIAEKTDNKNDLYLLEDSLFKELFKTKTQVFEFNNSKNIPSQGTLINIEYNFILYFTVDKIKCEMIFDDIFYNIHVTDINKKLHMIFKFDIMQLKDWYSFRVEALK